MLAILQVKRKACQRLLVLLSVQKPDQAWIFLAPACPPPGAFCASFPARSPAAAVTHHQPGKLRTLTHLGPDASLGPDVDGGGAGLDTLVLDHLCIAAKFWTRSSWTRSSWTRSPANGCCWLEDHLQAPCQDGLRTACPGHAHCSANTPIAANLSCTSWSVSGPPQGTWCKSVARSGTWPATYGVRQFLLQQAQKPTAW